MAFVVTHVARKKIAKARRVGTIATVVGFAVGDGACDELGNINIPNEYDNTLKHELFRRESTSIEEIDDTCIRYTLLLSKDEFENGKFNEIALYDSEGDLLYIRTFKTKDKDPDMELIFEIDDQY